MWKNEESALEFVEQVKSSTGMPDITAGLMRSDSARKRCGAATTASRRERPGNRCWTCCSAQGMLCGSCGDAIFRGTLLGTGGLVRAYSRSVQEGLQACEIIERKYGALFSVQTDYNGLGKIQYLLGQQDIPIMDVIYGEDVDMKILLPVSLAGKLQSDITEATSGKAMIHREEDLYFAVKDKMILTGDALLAEEN